MRNRLEAEASALLKLILCDYDELATPETPVDPYALDERKRRVKRKVWQLLRLAGRSEGA